MVSSSIASFVLSPPNHRYQRHAETTDRKIGKHCRNNGQDPIAQNLAEETKVVDVFRELIPANTATEHASGCCANLNFPQSVLSAHLDYGLRGVKLHSVDLFDRTQLRMACGDRSVGNLSKGQTVFKDWRNS